MFCANNEEDLLALCLFFVRSPIERHRKWVLEQLEKHPNWAILSDFTGFLAEIPWDCSGTDFGNGIQGALILLELCKEKASLKMGEIHGFRHTNESPKC